MSPNKNSEHLWAPEHLGEHLVFRGAHLKKSLDLGLWAPEHLEHLVLKFLSTYIYVCVYILLLFFCAKEEGPGAQGAQVLITAGYHMFLRWAPGF